MVMLTAKELKKDIIEQTGCLLISYADLKRIFNCGETRAKNIVYDLPTFFSKHKGKMYYVSDIADRLFSLYNQ